MNPYGSISTSSYICIDCPKQKRIDPPPGNITHGSEEVEELVALSGNIRTSDITLSDGRSAKLYYNASIASADDNSITVIGFLHGTLIPVENYNYIYNALLDVVSQKYVIVAPTYVLHTVLSYDSFRDETIESMQICIGNGPSAQPTMLVNKMNGRWCGMGHSLGGGVLALVETDYINTNPDCGGIVMIAPAIDATINAVLGGCNTPTLVLAGSKDCVVAFPFGQKPLVGYNLMINNNDRAYCEITGATHCNWSPGSLPCLAAQAFCWHYPHISGIPQRAATITLIDAFLANPLSPMVTLTPYLNGTLSLPYNVQISSYCLNACP